MIRLNMSRITLSEPVILGARGEGGFVSLFTTIMISLLLLVITISLVSLQALQLRKAQDAEQTLRAYYAAEAGVEDAVSRVLNDPLNRTDQPCVAKGNYDIPGAAGWTCQQITFSGTPKGELKVADMAKTIDPGHVAAPPYGSVIIEWGQSSSAAGPYTVPTGGLPSKAAYGAAVPPIELSVTSYPSGGFRASDVCSTTGAPVGCSVKQQNVLMVPRGTAASSVSFASLLGGGQRNGNCAAMPRTYTIGSNTLTGYNCYAVLTNLNPSNDYLFRIRSRYLPTTYRMTFMTGATGGGSVVKVPDGTATIDVTAKAGQTYRRVISKLPLGDGAAGSLNYVIYSDTNVCKNFSVLDNAAPPPNSGC